MTRNKHHAKNAYHVLSISDAVVHAVLRRVTRDVIGFLDILNIDMLKSQVRIIYDRAIRSGSAGLQIKRQERESCLMRAALSR